MLVLREDYPFHAIDFGIAARQKITTRERRN
jgi:hypothetical protein